MPETQVGVVTHFFARPLVAGVDLTAPLKVGDRVRIHGHTTDLTCTIESMQIEHTPITEAKAGDSVGIKVPDRVRAGDKVYKVTP